MIVAMVLAYRLAWLDLAELADAVHLRVTQALLRRFGVIHW